jgi:hypothetical protein
MEYSAKARLPLQLCRCHLSFALLINSQLVGEKIGPTGENSKGSQDSSFLAINAKGGEIIGPKQKDRTTTPFFQKLFHKKEEIISTGIYFTKGKKSFQLQKPS